MSGSKSILMVPFGIRSPLPTLIDTDCLHGLIVAVRTDPFLECGIARINLCTLLHLSLAFQTIFSH